MMITQCPRKWHACKDKSLVSDICSQKVRPAMKQIDLSTLVRMEWSESQSGNMKVAQILWQYLMLFCCRHFLILFSCKLTTIFIWFGIQTIMTTCKLKLCYLNSIRLWYFARYIENCILWDCSHVELSNYIWHTKGKRYRLCKFENQISDNIFVLDLKEYFAGKYYQFERCQKLRCNSSENSSKQNSILFYILKARRQDFANSHKVFICALQFTFVSSFYIVK